MIKIKRVGTFDKMLESLCVEDERLIDKVEKAIIRFQKNPSDTRLKNHKLVGRLAGKWAFNITADLRIVYEWQGKNTVRFIAIGTHSQVYNHRNIAKPFSS